MDTIVKERTEISADNELKSVKRVLLFALAILAFYLPYGYYRYVIIANVPLVDYPLLIVGSRTLGIVGFYLIATAVGARALTILFPRITIFRYFLNDRKWHGIIGFMIIVMHAIHSIVVIRPEYQPFARELFDPVTKRYSIPLQILFMLGSLNLIILSVLAFTSLEGIRRSMGGALWRSVHRLGTVCLIIGLLHMGLEAWGFWFRWPWRGNIPHPTFFLLAYVLFILGARIVASLTKRNTLA